jgi:WD40 repeat protein
VTTTTTVFGATPVLWVLDRTTGSTSHLGLTDMEVPPSAIAFPSDSQMVAIDGSAYGTWYRISLPTLTRIAGSNAGFGVQNSASALAPDGSYFTYSNEASPLSIWPSEGSPDIDKPALLAKTQAGQVAALALSDGGSWAAASVGSSIYVSRTAASGQTPAAPVALPGAGLVSPGALAFLGTTGSKLISASGDTVSLWDLSQYSRIATEAEAVVPQACNACRTPRIALSPNGRSAAVIDGNGEALDVQGLDPPGANRQAVWGMPLRDDPQYAAALWRNDGSGVLVVLANGSAQTLTPDDHGLRITGTWPPLPNPHPVTDPAAVLQFLPGDRQVVELDSSGTIRFRDAVTGKVLRQLNGPKSMAPTAGSFWSVPDLSQGWAALDPQAAHAAVIHYDISSDSSEVLVTDTTTGSSGPLHSVDAAGFAYAGVAYAGDHLLVQRSDGDLEIWNASGSQHLSTIEGTPGTIVGPVVGGNLIAEKPSDDTVQLIDLPSGNVLGTLTLPPGNKPVSTGLAFSADGTELVTATEVPGANWTTGIGQLIDWQLDPNAWIRAACASAGGELTADLWKRYLDADVPSNLRCTP